MIGTAIVCCALEQNIETFRIVRKNSGRLDNLPKHERLRIIAADLSEYAHLDISGTYDVFFHLAWDKTFGKERDDVDTQVKNIEYTLDAVRLAKRLDCSVFSDELLDGPLVFREYSDMFPYLPKEEYQKNMIAE
jgi:nucleoside-diphosphate-sugar epimerase